MGAARWAKVREEGLARNAELLIDSVPRTLDPEVIATAAADLPRPTIAEAIQIQRLYRRDGEGGEARGRGGRTWRPKSLGEVHESILKKLSAIARVRDAEKLAKGWVQDEAGHWIPPGWVRRESPS